MKVKLLTFLLLFTFYLTFRQEKRWAYWY